MAVKGKGYEVGVAYMPVLPDFSGYSKAAESGVQDALKPAQRAVDKALAPSPSASKAAGRKAGEETGRGWVEGTTAWIDRNSRTLDSGGVGEKLAGGVLTGVRRTIVGGMAAIGGVAVTALYKGAGRLAAIEDSRSMLAGLKMDAQTIDQVSKDTLASVKGTAFGLDAGMKAATMAVAAGVKPGKDLERTLRLVGDAATITKSDLDEMGSIFAKVAAQGKLTGDVAQQLTERGIPVLDMVAKQYGVTTEAAQKMVSNGQVTFTDFQKMVETRMGGAALKSGDTATGAFANVQAALGRLGAAFLAPVFGDLPGLFKDLTARLDELAPAAESFGKIAGEQARRAFDFLKDPVIPAVADLVEKVKSLVGFFQDNESALKALLTALGGVAAFLTTTFAVAMARAVLSTAASTVEWWRNATAATASGAATSRTAAQVVVGWAVMGVRAAASAAVIVAGWLWIGAQAVATGVRYVATWALMSAQSLLHAARIAAAWLISMGPIALVIAAVVGLAALIFLNMDRIKGWIGAAWEWVKSSTGAAWDWITSKVSGALSWVQGRVDAARAFIGSAFDRIKDGAASVGSAFSSMRDTIGRVWEQVKGHVARPINFVIDKINDPLIGGVNNVASKVGLGDNWIPRLRRIDGYAAGGRIPGQSPGPGVDNRWGLVDGRHPVRVASGEWIIRGSSAAMYGDETMRAVNEGRALIWPGLASGGPVWQTMWEWARRHIPGVVLTSGQRATPDYHGQGKAIDIAAPMTASGKAAMMNAAAILYNTFGSSILELIHTPFSPNLWHGRPHSYSPATQAQHWDHVHWAMASLDGSAAPGAGGVFEWVKSKVRDVANDALSKTLGLIGREPPLPRGLAYGMVEKAGRSLIEFLVGKAPEDLPDPVYSTGDYSASASARQAVLAAASKRGWGSGGQWSALDWIIQRESGWNPAAQNPTSTAYGRGQFLDSTWATVGMLKSSDVNTQAEALMRYIAQRYGTPLAAQAFWRANGWYSGGGRVPVFDAGGVLAPGLNTVYNGTGRPEPLVRADRGGVQVFMAFDGQSVRDVSREEYERLNRYGTRLARMTTRTGA